MLLGAAGLARLANSAWCPVANPACQPCLSKECWRWYSGRPAWPGLQILPGAPLPTLPANPASPRNVEFGLPVLAVPRPSSQARKSRGARFPFHVRYTPGLPAVREDPTVGEDLACTGSLFRPPLGKAGCPSPQFASPDVTGRPVPLSHQIHSGVAGSEGESHRSGPPAALNYYLALLLYILHCRGGPKAPLRGRPQEPPLIGGLGGEDPKP